MVCSIQDVVKNSKRNFLGILKSDQNQSGGLSKRCTTVRRPYMVQYKAQIRVGKTPVFTALLLQPQTRTQTRSNLSTDEKSGRYIHTFVYLIAEGFLVTTFV